MSTREQEKVPRALRPRFDAVTRRTDAFCEEYLDDDYAALCRRMAAALARKRPSPLERGGIEGWACGIVHAAGSHNFLFDKSFDPYVSAAGIADRFGVGRSTGAAQARAVKDAMKMRPYDWTWMVPAMIERNPLVWLVEVDGIPIDARELPRGLQEDAFRRDLIPYVPARRPERSSAGPDELELPAMSGILIDVAEPFLESIRDDAPLDEYLGALSFAAGVWNASRHLSDAEEALAPLKDALVATVGATPERANALVAELYARSRELHPDETREIRHVDAYFAADELRVRVMSVFPEEV